MPAGPPDPTSLQRPWLDAYPPGVPPTYQLPAVALPRLLDDAVRDFPDRDALVVAAGTLDHAALRDRVREVQETLVDAGLGAGDRVLLALPNLASLPVVLFAVWRVGAVAVPVAPGVRRERLLAIAADAQVRAVVASRRLAHVVADDADDRMLAFVVADDRWLFPRRLARVRRLPGRVAEPVLRRVRPGRARVTGLGDDPVRLDATISGPSPHQEDDRPDGPEADRVDAATPDRISVAPIAVPRTPGADDLALLAYRTGDPEPHGVAYHHADLVAAAFAVRLWIPDVQAGRERVLVADPVTDLAPLVLGLLTGLLSAATVVLTDDPDAAALTRAIERERPTLLPTSTRRLSRLLGEGEAAKRDLTSLRVVLTTGPAVDRQLALDVERRTGGARVRSGFGSPETGPFTLAQPVYGRVAPGAVGLPVTDTVAVVVQPDDPSVPCPVGSTGLLLVRGPQTGRGYWGRPSASASRFVDGWVVTDDLAVMDDDGIFRHVGHRDEVVRRGDVLVAPRRVEAALETHPAVRQAGVVEGTDGRLLAAVVLRRRHRPAVDDLLVHCRAHLDSPEVPDHVTLVHELPENEAGDLARDVLRAQLAGPGGDAS